MSRYAVLLALLSVASHVTAQTSTDCNPLNSTCPDDPALGTTFSMTFNESMSEFDPRFFTVEAGAELVEFTENGAELTITNQGDSVTVYTAFYVFFGQIEVLFQAASGQGIISTFNMLSDDLDEIDVEIMGGNTTFTSTNYYGWGNLEQFNTEYIASTGPGWGTEGAMGAVHNYTIDWTPEKVDWIFDGQTVRSVPSGPAGEWPQTPSFLKFGIWAGGDPDLPRGTRDWAGGDTDYSQGPFTMTVKSIRLTDAHQHSAKYSYGDDSGTWESINIERGRSDALKAINEKTTVEQLEHKWEGLSTGAKIGIAGAVLGVFAIALVAFVFYCMKQRRAGKREKAIADQAWDAQQAELVHYRNQMKRGDFAVGFMGHGEKR